MQQKYRIILAILVIFSTANGQNNFRKMDSPFNHPSLNYWSPFISLDGTGLLFQCDNTEKRQPGLFFASKSGASWKDPILLPKNLNNAIQFLDGSTLSADGKEIWISAQRGGGIGGFDLFSFQIKSDGFGDGKNPGLPLNSKEHEASAVFTPDGGTIYFMRCATMNNFQASGCRILTSKKKLNGTWETPVELPQHINKGNSQFPRILADAETLIFHSDKHQPNTGGLDIYMTRWDGVSWSDAVALPFLNSEKGDRPVSITSFGRSVLTAKAGVKKSELVDIFFPPELKPKPVLRINGVITGVKDPGSMYLSLYDSVSGGQLRSLRPDATGGFILFIRYGGVYKLFADPAADQLPFFSKTYDLSAGEGQVVGKLTIDPGQLISGSRIDLGLIAFQENAAPVPGSNPMLTRVIRLMRSNPNLSFMVICDNAEWYDIFFRYLRKKGINNNMELMIPESPGGKMILVVK